MTTMQKGDHRMTSDHPDSRYTYALHTGLGLVGHSNRPPRTRSIFLVAFFVVLVFALVVLSGGIRFDFL
ncbi:MAG: hypothetical protein GX423_13715 [Nitrospiraceae bacterium]|nr:hypothetical protein [Nitrospiraceae bacterium]